MRRISTGLLVVVAAIVVTLWWQRRTVLGAEGFVGGGAIALGTLGGLVAAVLVGWLLYSIVAGRGGGAGQPLLGKVLN